MVVSTRNETRALDRLLPAVVALIGVFLFAFPLAINLFGKTSSTRDLMDAMRPQMSDTALAQNSTDLATVSAMATQLQTQMLPALATQLHMTQDQLNAFLGQNLPATAQGMSALPATMDNMTSMASLMKAQQANYQQADRIPLTSVPPTTMPWLFMIPGAVLAFAGGLALLRPRYVRAALATGGIVGLALVGGLLAASLAPKAQAADDMIGAFKPVFATPAVQQLRTETNTMAAMTQEFTTTGMTQFSAALHITPAQLQQMMVSTYPAVASGVAQMPGILQRMQTTTALVESQAGNYGQAAAIPWENSSMMTLFWFMMVPAIGLVILAAAGLLTEQRLHPAVPAHTLRRRMLPH